MQERAVSNYAMDDVPATSTYYLTDGPVLKDNDQCGRYCVNDPADVSKMRLRVAGCSRNRFVITTLCASFRGLRLTERRTNKQRERGLAGARIYRALQGS